MNVLRNFSAGKYISISELNWLQNHKFLAPVLFSPRVQQPAPYFKGTAVIGDDFKEIQLSDYKGKYVVLVFYPLDL